MRPEDIDRILVSPAELHERVVALGEQISADYADRTIMLVGVLKGVTFFLADLARAITRPLAIDYLAVAGYGTPAKGRSRQPGAVRIIKDLDEQITGQHVILVEDVVNTGLSLAYILKHLQGEETREYRGGYACSIRPIGGWWMSRSITSASPARTSS